MQFKTIDRSRLAKVIKFLEESLRSDGIDIPETTPETSASRARSKLSLKPKVIPHPQPASNQSTMRPISRKGNGYR